MIIESYKHKMAAHCETGALTGLLNHAGLEITEPMAFGIGRGIFFGYFKSSRFTFPVIVTRTKPGQIRNKIANLPDMEFYSAKYRNPLKAEEELDLLIEKKIPVAVQVDFFYMDYASYEGVHNNTHFITIIGKNGSKYIVSDSYYTKIQEIERESLRKARFAKGLMAPKGFMYYVKSVPDKIDYEKYIIKGIKKACFNMLKIPIPFIGVKGIHKFADKIVLWPKHTRDIEHLSHEIMKIHIFLEDQGTGGAGFRFLYATFLRQASEILNDQKLLTFSERIMKIGDNWRNISLFTTRIGKKRELGEEKIQELSNMIRERAYEEKEFFSDLYKYIKSNNK